MFKFFDLHSFGTFFGQPSRRGPTTTEKEHHDAEYQHYQAPPQVHVQAQLPLQNFPACEQAN